ncbi:inhibitor of nuclear factor kappa-B kinase-interacting protein isoform X2 [Astyanax mexicanus]|uniref:IKBKB interacting protein n=1 Tax=Astyanax mexicanus TaxID=7994 RepID=A0A8B9GZG1_ASTMX|nr:inhibitor of nuclear factor kappa-B kinase-interacting protein isoform X2 [Astyanax mexicanus]
MPGTEVKHRKGKSALPQDGTTNGTSEPSLRSEGKTAAAGPSEEKQQPAGDPARLGSSVDLKTAVSLLSLTACLLLAWVVIQQNARFNEVEEKYRHLHEKTADLLLLEERLGTVSKKLEASEDHLKGAISTVTAVVRLEKDITSLNAAVMTMQEDQEASSLRLQKVNDRFLNVTEAWQEGLGVVTDELVKLRSESRSVHVRVTEQVNDAEGRLRALSERLEEVEDGTRRNARLLERTEEEDAKRVQSHLDWNTGQCEGVQLLLESKEVRSPISHLSRLEKEVSQLKDWSSSLNERRQQMQEKMAALLEAVQRIENRTTAISSDVTAKVASVRTDVRRMGGLEGEVDALLSRTGQLEDKVNNAEKQMVKRVGEVLAASIDRISSLKSSTEKNTQSLEKIRKQIPELSATDKKLYDRIVALESSRAKLVRTVTFASELKPKVFTIKQDFAMLEPQLADIIFRIGNLAEDVMKREEDIIQLKQSLTNFMTVQEELKQSEENLEVKLVSSDMGIQNDLSKTLIETDWSN